MLSVISSVSSWANKVRSDLEEELHHRRLPRSAVPTGCQDAVIGANASRPCVAGHRSGGPEVRSPAQTESGQKRKY